MALYFPHFRSKASIGIGLLKARLPVILTHRHTIDFRRNLLGRIVNV